VRFGTSGSCGSVVLTFRCRQIETGHRHHPEMTCYFMMIPEAVSWSSRPALPRGCSYGTYVPERGWATR